jgi:cytochrome P450
VDIYIALLIFGTNIVASEGEEWKKYRKIAAPAFSEVSLELEPSPRSEYDHQRNNKLVWDETNRIMVDLFDNVWGNKAEIIVDHCLDITLPVRRPCLIRHPNPNLSTRLLCSSSASQVVFVPFRL